MSARLLLLEDDPAIARTVAYALERDGLTVTHSLLVHDARQQLPVSYTHLTLPTNREV